MLIERLGCPCPKGIHHGIEPTKVCCHQIHDVFLDGVLCIGLVLAARDGRHVLAATDELLHDEPACLAVCCHDCDLHVRLPFLWALSPC